MYGGGLRSGCGSGCGTSDVETFPCEYCGKHLSMLTG